MPAPNMQGQCVVPERCIAVPLFAGYHISIWDTTA